MHKNAPVSKPEKFKPLQKYSFPDYGNSKGAYGHTSKFLQTGPLPELYYKGTCNSFAMFYG